MTQTKILAFDDDAVAGKAHEQSPHPDAGSRFDLDQPGLPALSLIYG